MVNPTEYVPKSYFPRVSTYWWLARWPYLKFIVRELSSVFVALFVVVTLLQIRALINGPEAYANFEVWLRNPLVLALNSVSFLFVMFHAVTWFNLAPKAMTVRMAGKRIPGIAIAASNYVLWLVASAVIVWLLLRG
jgi:fumarate reductase subunit C